MFFFFFLCCFVVLGFGGWRSLHPLLEACCTFVDVQVAKSWHIFFDPWDLVGRDVLEAEQ